MKKQIRLNSKPGTTIVRSRNYKGNRYKLSAQWFLGWFLWRSVSYDWLIIALNTIDQSKLTLLSSQKSLHPMLVPILRRISEVQSSLLCLETRELSQRRIPVHWLDREITQSLWRRQRESRKNNLNLRASHFLVHFVAVVFAARLRRERSGFDDGCHVFPAKMTLLHSCALLSIEKISLS